MLRGHSLKDNQPAKRRIAPCVICGVLVRYKSTVPKYCSSCYYAKTHAHTTRATFAPVKSQPGFCSRCGVIRLASGDTGLCHDCEIEAVMERTVRYA